MSSRYLICFLFAFSFLFPQHLSAQTHTAKSVIVSSRCGGYWEYLPANYNVGNKYPIIIYIHGAGSYGTGSNANLQALLTNEGIAYYINQGQFPSSFTVNGQTSSFIVISPQFTQKPSPNDVKLVIDYMVQNYPVDQARIYLTGYSVGGDVAWKAPFNHAAALRLAALAPVAGYNRDPYVDTTAKYIAGANLPVWAIHSTNDAAVPIQASIDMVNKINSFNPTVPAILTSLNNVPHDLTVRTAYNPTFKPNGKNLYEWFLSYNRNYPPIAKAGPDQNGSLPQNSFNLNGSTSSDPENGPLLYEWSKISGPSAFAIANKNAAQTTVSGLVAGVYQFRLVVTDNAGISSADTMKITVINPNPNTLPVANPGQNQVISLPQTSVILDGTASSDPGGVVEQYSWTKIQGPAQFSIASPNSAVTTVNNLRPGTYQFRLTVTDNEGGSASAVVQVHVINPYPNVLPVANAGNDQTIELPLNSVNLSGALSSDADGALISYHWQQVSGPAASVITQPNNITTTAANLALGTYQFQLTVTDDSSAIDRDTITVFVNPIPPAVTQKLIRVNVYGGSNPAGTGWNNWNVSSLNSGILKYTDGINSTVTAALSAHTIVADNGTNYPTTMCPVEVGRTASYHTANRTLTLSGLDNSKRYDFEAYASRIGGNPTRFTINGTAITIQTNNNYTNKAIFTNLTPSAGKITVNIDVLMTFCYINGFTLIEKTTSPVNAGPVASAGQNQSITQPASQASLDGSASYDPDGSISSFNWQQTSGPSCVITNPGQPATTVTGMSATGTYQFRLTVIDNQGYTASSNVSIVVEPPLNLQPVANAGLDQTIDLPINQVQLDGSTSSDPDGTIASFHWTKTSGPAAFTLSDDSIPNPVLSGLVEGDYIFKLKVTDNGNASAEDEVKIKVRNPFNAPPVAEAGLPQTITLPVSQVNLDASGSMDTDGNITSYTWSQQSGPSNALFNNTGIVNPVVSGLIAGDYVFVVTVTDNSGASASDEIAIKVLPPLNLAPTVEAGNNQVISLPANSVQLSGIAQDQDGTIVSYQWSLPSGGSPSILSPNNAVTQVSGFTQGIYVFYLTVTDDDGATAVDSVKITVNALPATCTAKRIVVLGSSTAAGTGADPGTNSWVSKFTQYMKQLNPANEVINLAFSGQNTYHIMPTGSTPPAGRPNPNTGNNVTMALSYSPHAIIINMPSNDAGSGFSIAEQQTNFNTIVTTALNANVPVWVTTTQPRNLDATGRANLATMRDWIFTTYGNKAIDVWTTLANPDGTIHITYALGDGIHINNAGHQLIYDRVIGSNILSALCNGANQLPVVNAGGDQTITVPANSASLNGTASDPDGQIVSIQWSQVMGAPANIQPLNNLNTTVSNLALGNYTFRLTVIDNFGAVRFDEININVVPDNQPPAENGLVVHYTFDAQDLNWSNPNAEVIDRISNINGNATGLNSTHVVTGKIGNALKFSGAQYVASTAAAAYLLPGQNYTVTAWINAPSTVGNMSIFGKATVTNRECQLLLNTSASLSAFVGGTNNTSSTPVPSNQWVHVALVNNASTNTNSIYLNGNLVKSLNTGSTLSAGIDLLIGARRNNNNTDAAVFYNGSIDEFRIYNRALPTSEILGLYNQSGSGTPVNQPPVVNAGDNLTVSYPSTSAQLNGSASDPDNHPLSFNWTQVSGPSTAAISNNAILNPTVSNLVGGTYIFRLAVSDNNGGNVSDDVSVIVSGPPVNQPPVANAGVNQTITLPVNQASLSAILSSDADGTIVNYLWSYQSGPQGFQIDDVNAIGPQVTGLVQGTYVFRVTVTDDDGATSSANVTIAVVPPAPPSRWVRVNIYGGVNGYSDPQWNNWNTGGNSIPTGSGLLRYEDGTVSTISATLSNQTLVVDNGSGFPTVMCPSAVGRTANYHTAPRTLTISGTDPSKTYELELYASRNSSGSGTTRFTVNSTVVNIATNNNYTNKALFNNLIPNANGQIQVTITNVNTFNYINGFSINEIAGTIMTRGVVVSQPADAIAFEEDMSGLSLNPNPVKQDVSLTVKNAYNGLIRLQILDVHGKLVNEYKISKTQEVIRYQLQTGKLAPGMYMIRIQMGETVKTLKMIRS